MIKRAALIAACIGIAVGYCLPHTPTLTDIKVGQDYIVATYSDTYVKRSGIGTFIYDGGVSAVSNKRAINSPLKHAPLHDGANYIVKFNGDIAVEWYRLK